MLDIEKKITKLFRKKIELRFVGKDTGNVCEDRKLAIDAVRQALQSTADEAREEEKVAWQEGKRCDNCGEEKKVNLTSMCDKCIEEE